MSLITDIIVAAADAFQGFVKFQSKLLASTIEDQSKVMECCMRRLCYWLGLMSLCMMLLLAGMALIAIGAYILLASATNSGVAAMIIGVIITLLAIILTILVKNCVK